MLFTALLPVRTSKHIFVTVSKKSSVTKILRLSNHLIFILTVGEFQESLAKYIISREDKETFSLDVHLSLTRERPEEIKV